MPIWLIKMKPISQRPSTSAQSLESTQSADAALERRDVAARALRDVALPELPPWLDMQILSAAQEQAQLQQQKKGGVRSLTRQPWFKFGLPAATAAVVLISVYLPTVHVTKQGVALPAEGSLPAPSAADSNAKNPSAPSMADSALPQQKLEETAAAHTTDPETISLAKLPDQSQAKAKEVHPKGASDGNTAQERAKSEPNFKFDAGLLQRREQPHLEKSTEKATVLSSEVAIFSSTENHPPAPASTAPAPRPFPADRARDKLSDVKEDKKRESSSLGTGILLGKSAAAVQEAASSSHNIETKPSKASSERINPSVELAGTVSGPGQAQTKQTEKEVFSPGLRSPLPQQPVPATPANADTYGKTLNKAFTWEEGFLNEEYFQIRKLLRENKPVEAKTRLKALLKAQPDLILPPDLKEVMQDPAGKN